MKSNSFSAMTDEELLVEKKKMNKSKFWHATFIGFLAGVVIFGLGAWVFNPERRVGFFIPIIFPIYFIYKLVTKPNNNKELEDALKERNLY